MRPAERLTRDRQAYNSIFNADQTALQSRQVGNFPLLALRTKTRGPAYTLPPLAADGLAPGELSPDADSESYDILDEVLGLFRANTFFRNFELQGPADRLLVYGIWFVSDCLSKIKPSAGVRDATKDVMNLALDLNFAIPGDPAWPLNQAGSPCISLSLSILPSANRCPPSTDVRTPHRPTRCRTPAPVHVPGPPGAGRPAARQGVPGRWRRQAEQVVAQLHQAQVYGQRAVTDRD